jgi:hypothetical protein
MASRGKKKTTMAKLNREAKLRERKRDKQARKEARKEAAASAAAEQPIAPGDTLPDNETEAVSPSN